MKGKIVEKDREVYIEYITEGTELDAVEKRLIKVSLDRAVGIGEEVEFEIRDSYNISDEQIAKIK